MPNYEMERRETGLLIWYLVEKWLTVMMRELLINSFEREVVISNLTHGCTF
jgi:hypothetical protein